MLYRQTDEASMAENILQLGDVLCQTNNKIMNYKLQTLLKKRKSLKIRASKCWDINELDIINAELAKVEDKISNEKAVQDHHFKMVEKILKSNL
tara:strand:+ start:389 stop:670 length:282 start_codon:yes stop_codon:yes gene_type:complete